MRKLRYREADISEIIHILGQSTIAAETGLSFYFFSCLRGIPILRPAFSGQGSFFVLS